jgi:hypothetical protein
MPKINSKVFTADQQQRRRRMKERNKKFIEEFDKNNIKCVSLYKLYDASADELTALIPIIKKIIIHNAKTAELIKEGVYKPEPIKPDEYNVSLYNTLFAKYNNQHGKTLKYKYDHKKDTFKQTIIEENQELFNKNISSNNSNTITKLFNDIDISKFELSERFINKEKKAAEEKKAIIVEEEPKEEKKKKEPKPKPKEEPKPKPKKEEPKEEPKPKPKPKKQMGPKQIIEMDKNDKYFIVPDLIKNSTNRANKSKYTLRVSKLNELIDSIEEMKKFDEPEKLQKLNYFKKQGMAELIYEE